MANQKFQLSYSPFEDRVIVIMTQDDDSELAFALTRRLIKQLWPGLSKIIKQASEIIQNEAPAVEEGRKPERFDHNTAVAQAKAQVRRELDERAAADQSAAPAAGEEAPQAKPVPERRNHLTRKLQIVDKSEKLKILVLTDGAASLRLPLNPHQIVAFTDGLKQMIKRAEWDLRVDFEWEQAVVIDPDRELTIDITADSPSRYKH